ncbi:hypothetical protein QVD17_23148 [Tagetes erecta]|uniref:Homeobox-leucine zipper protein n=1 Tax=Tagetes erecta TaxID=13708 RepID=A0AAD8NM25_TARER|nr:hypothetical protein QVD17_23148 [Tagetes erecta]
MEWSSMPFIPRSSQTSFSFLYTHDPYLYPPPPAPPHTPTAMMDQLNQFDNNNNDNLDKKKRLTSDQLEALENSFQEEIKLDPDRKIKLAHELGLQPRQIAVWFQNRRARWKAKQLERLYDTLKREFDVVFREKQKLQHEVLALRTILKEHVSNRQAEVSTPGYTDMSGEETVESTPGTAIHSSNNQAVAAVDCNYNMVSYDGAAMHTSSYSNWAGLASYP